MEKEHQIPIWFFIGTLLAIYGVLIVGSGIYGWISPPDHKVVLWEMHADVWWGFMLIVLGIFYSVRYRPRTAGHRGR